MRSWCSILILVLVLVACGGGGGGGFAGGGVGGSGISAGAITGFASIFVTGTEYDVSTAQIELERAPATEAELRLGMVVVVYGDRSEDGLTGTAIRVTFDDEIDGPISAVAPVSLDELELTILGQVVSVERSAVHFEGPGLFGFDTIALNDRVEVSGFRDRTTGRIRATYIAKEGMLAPGDTPEVELKGTVSGRAGTTFLIGSVLVTFDGSTEIDDLPAGEPQNGDFVAVEGILAAPSSVVAARIEGEHPFAGDRAEFELEGLVGNFVSLAVFEVSGQPVDAGAASVVFEPADPSFIANGVRVEVEGELRNGRVVATKVKLREGEVRVHAELASLGDVNPAAGTFELLGIPFRVDASTQLDDERDESPTFGLAEIAAGDFLEVRGIDDGAGAVLATEIRREEPDDVRLVGRTEAIDAVLPDRSVTILGVVVPTDAETEFDDFPGSVEDEDDFYDFVEIGDLLDVTDEDPERTSIDVADEIEFEED